MSERLVIIDGKSVFYRGYYAMPGLSTKDGTPTGGVYGFAVMALEVIKRLKPDYVCVAWDKRGTNIRKRLELYPAYKGNRKAAPPDFYEQLPMLFELLESLGWPLYELDDYEADDLMGTFAQQAGKKDIESYLVTSDLDVLQLVNSHTHIYTLKKGLTHIELFSQAHFEEKYGVGPHQWVDVKALKGDASDNIPGVAGVGEKTALDLISKYETLDGVYENIDLLKPALATKLKAGHAMAYLSQKLVTLMCDAPLEMDFDKARLHPGVRPEFVAELRKLEFRNLLRQVETEQPAADNASDAPATVTGPSLPSAKIITYDAKKFAAGKPRVLELNSDATELWVSAVPGEVAAISLKKLKAADVATLADGPVVGHDLKSVFRELLARGHEWPGEIGHDTRIAAFLLNSLLRAHELSDLLAMDVDAANPEQVIPAIWKLFEEQTAALKALPTVEKLAREIEFPTIYLLAKVESRGILLNSDYLHKMGVEFGEKIAKIEHDIYKHAGQEFNIASPAQLGMILFEKLQLPTAGVKKGKTGYSTGAVELAKLRELHPIVDLITEYREYTKLKSTYIDTLPTYADAAGRVHTTYALDVAPTGRLSSNNPNLQNIPTRTEIGQNIRRAFVAGKGNVFISADYSQFELRLAAVMGHDQPLIDDFNAGVDIHTKTAAEVYGVPLDQVTKDMRRHANVVNFGILYGMSPHGLGIATGMSFVDAKVFIDKYFELRAPIRQYIDQVLAQGLRDGYVETMFGRRRPTPDLKSSNFMVREAAKRQAMNMPIQGTEADLMKLAMLQVEERLAGEPGKALLGEQLLQVHDSILVECPEENLEIVSKILKETMESVYKLAVKLDVTVSSGKTWGDVA